jgi:hypothetical protein
MEMRSSSRPNGELKTVLPLGIGHQVKNMKLLFRLLVICYLGGTIEQFISNAPADFPEPAAGMLIKPWPCENYTGTSKSIMFTMIHSRTNPAKHAYLPLKIA